MKYYFIVTVFIFGSFFIGKDSLAINSDIIINEIGAYPTSTHEWIEIWNRGVEPVDIKDWKFWENNTNHGISATTSTDSVISVNEYAVICQDVDIFKIDNPNFVGSVFDSSWSSLSENGESIGLKDETGNFVEQFDYVSMTKYSLERINPFENNYNSDNWQENINGNSLGLKNTNYYLVDSFQSTSTTTTPVSIMVNLTSPTSTDNLILWNFIKLNEVISDPINGNELVELYNAGSSTVDITGGSICDSTKSSCSKLSGLIKSHDWLVADMLSDRYFNNTGDTVILNNSTNEVVDQVVYGTTELVYPEKGQSIIRLVDGFDSDLDANWGVTTKLTPGLVNELVKDVMNNFSGGATNNSSISGNTISTQNSSTANKIIKLNTSTKQIAAVKDSVNINWKLDWPYGLDVAEVGSFSVKGTADPRGGEVIFNWSFGDGVSSTGHILEHSYATSGVFNISVTASSSAGTYGKKDFIVHVGPTYSISNSQVKIESFQVTSTEDVEEYIQLKNYSDKSQNISGWKIKNKSGKEYELPENTLIAASGTLKFYKSIHHLIFDKNGDEIRLTSPNDNEINKVLLTVGKKIKEVKKVSAKLLSNWLSVRGVVTVEPKTFGQQYFYISDGQSGFQIYQYKKDFPNLKIGNYISVGGETSIIDGVTRIKINNKNAIKILEQNKMISPIELNIEDVEEPLLGSLVKLSGDITEIKSNLMYVDNGNIEIEIYFKKGATIDKQELKEGDKVEVVGILNRGKDGWQILPRSISDLIVIGHVDEVLADRLSLDQKKQDATRNKYVTTTVSGLSALLLGFIAKARGAMIVAGVKKVVIMAGKFINRG